MDRPHLWPEVGRFAFSDQAAYDRRAETRNGTCVDWAAVDGAGAPAVDFADCAEATGRNLVGLGGFLWHAVPDGALAAAEAREAAAADAADVPDAEPRRPRPPDAGVALAPGWLAHHAGACDFVLVTCAREGDVARAREALGVIASAVLSAPRGPRRHALRFTVFCNHVAAKVLRRSMQRLMDMAWGRFGGEDLVTRRSAGPSTSTRTSSSRRTRPRSGSAVGTLAAARGRRGAAEHGDVAPSCEGSAEHYYNQSAAARALPRAFPDDGANTGVLALDAAAARDAGWGPTLAAVMADLAATKANGSLDLGDQSVFNVAAGGDQFTVARLPCEANFRTDFCQHAAYDCDRCAAAPLLLHAPRSAFHEGKFAYAPAFGRLYAFFLDALDSHDDGAGLAAAAARAAADFERLLDDGRAVARLPCRAIAELALSLVRAAPTR
ncbi:hypothetical protein JL722_7987 [Aureococcus anophagefferens]|nr:hypothetical protein JL722_7987 [Aureococcus anophagefferens]